MNSFAQRFNDDDEASSNWFLIKLEIPSKSILYSFVIPKVVDFTEKLSFPPYKIISMASLGIEAMGSESLKENFSAIICNCLNIQVLFCSPIGAKPPFLIEILSSGTIFWILISCIVPKPEQVGHA